MTRRPSRPIQASRLHGARWVYQSDGETAWSSLASLDMRYGWVESLPSFGSSTNRWHATLTSALVDLTDCVDGHVRVGQVFRTKRQAMRYLEIVAIAAWRRVLIAAAKKVAAMRAFTDTRPTPADIVEPLPWATDLATRAQVTP